MLKKGKVWGKKLVAGIMLAVMVLGNTTVSAEAATNDTGKKVAIVQENNYRKTLCKGFLGKSYGSVVDGRLMASITAASQTMVPSASSRRRMLSAMFMPRKNIGTRLQNISIWPTAVWMGVTYWTMTHHIRGRTTSHHRQSLMQ